MSNHRTKVRGDERCLWILALAVACVWITWFVMYTNANAVDDDPVVPYVSHSPLGRYSTAAVATDNILCSEIGRDVLIKGGNAVDAAVASLFCVGVMNPHSCGLGGGHFNTIYLKDSHKCISIDARETAPASATVNMYDENKKDSRIGYRSIATPGEVHGAFTAFSRFGSGNMSWTQLLQPTIDLLDDGYPISPTLANQFLSYRSRIADETNALHVYHNKLAGRPYKTGEIIRQPLLSRTLQLLARSSDPVGTFYRGELVDNFVNEFARAGFRDHLTRDDFANYRSVVYESQPFIPLTDVAEGGGLDVCAQPLPSGTPITIAIIKAVRAFGMSAANVTTVDAHVDFLHKFIEVSKYAYALRQEMGDPAFVTNATMIATNLTSDAFIADVVARVNVTGVHEDTNEYYVFNDNPIEHVPEDAGTAHIAIVDDRGNAVSLTSTINHYFGSKTGSASTGVLWNNEMDDFSQPARSNSFGLPPSAANYIAPGKRPLSSMSPLIVVDRHTAEPRLVIGASGGTRIITGVAHVAARALFADESLKVSVDAPRLHDQLTPARTLYERDLDERLVKKLGALGHTMKRYSGRHSVVTAVRFDDAADEWHRWTANSDFRKGATSRPAGY